METTTTVPIEKSPNNFSPTAIKHSVIATFNDLSKEARSALYDSICEKNNFLNLENFLLQETNLFLKNNVDYLNGQIVYLNDQIELRDLSLNCEKSNSYEQGFIHGRDSALEFPDELINKDVRSSFNENVEVLVIKTDEKKLNQKYVEKSETPISQGKFNISLSNQINLDDNLGDNLTIVSEISTIKESNRTIYSEENPSIEDTFSLVKRKYSKNTSCKFLNSLSNERAKSAFIATEKIVLEKLENINIKTGLLKWIFENQTVPKKHYASLSSHDVKHNPDFDNTFWSTIDGTKSDFSIIFNERNPQFKLVLMGKGHAATFEKIL